MKEYLFSNRKYVISLDLKNGLISDLHTHKHKTNLTDTVRPFGSFCYTLNTDKLNEGDKPGLTPWVDRTAQWECVSSDERKISLRNQFANLEYQFYDQFIELRLEKNNDDISQIGLNFPFNFLGKKGGAYHTQVIPTTPYSSSCSNIRYWFFDSPEGQPVLMVARGAAAWKLDYSEYVCGHFIINLKWLYQLDRIYHDHNDADRMELCLFFPDNFKEGMRLIAEHYHTPLLLSEKYCVGKNEEIELALYGKADTVEVRNDSDCTSFVLDENHTIRLSFQNDGLYTVIPFCNGIPGLECVIGVIDNYDTLMHRNILTLQEPYHCDRGICEGGVWAQAAIMHQRLLGRDEFVQSKIDAQLRDIMEGQIPRCSVPDKPDGIWPAYHIYHSLRVQEAFFGISLFVEAFQTYKEQKYLDYAVGMMEVLCNLYILEDGSVICRQQFGSAEYIDYTTVTAPVIAVVDLARVLKESGDERYRKYESVAIKIADHLIERGMNFPTEGGEVELTETEMEDGSISCTALSLCYVSYWITKKPEYISFAGEILKLHDNWSMKPQDVRMHGSSLRWWETLWEGDGDGPSICAGHAWTIWRAEAYFYYGLLTGDSEAFVKSYNGFATNLIKIQPDGSSFACYQPDMIHGGGFCGSAADVDQRLKAGYPEKKDHSLSKYLWVRLENTWYHTCVIYTDSTGRPAALNASIVRIDENTVTIKETVTKQERIINLTNYVIVRESW